MRRTGALASRALNRPDRDGVVAEPGHRPRSEEGVEITIPLHQFDTILFDLNGTLAESYDRFGPEQDYHATYRALGGESLSAREVKSIVEDTIGAVIRQYRDGPPRPFPALRDCFGPRASDLGEDQRVLLEETMASHECGRVPPGRIELLQRLAGDFRLGLVSDLWAPAGHCRAYLESLGLARLFSSQVFSSEHGAVKPARQLFERALMELDADPARTLFVGDDLERDVAGAAACGLATVWIGEPQRPNGADWTLRDVMELGV